MPPQGKRAQVLELIWEDFRKWDGTATRRRKRTALVGGVVIAAGFLGMVAATASERFATHPAGTALALGSAVLIALATFLGREVLGGDRERKWIGHRMLAEALKRLVWLGLLRVPPYDGDDGEVAEALDRRSNELTKSLALDRKDLPDDASTEPFPAAHDIDGYVKHRVDEQIGWYESRSARFARKHRRWRFSALALAAVAALVGAVGGFVKDLGLPVWVPVITTAVATIGSFLEAKRFLQLAVLYHETARRLKRAKIRLDGVELVAECERIMAEENGSWRAELESDPEPGAAG